MIFGGALGFAIGIATLAGMNDPVAINVSRAVGWSGSETLELARDGASTVAITFNYDNRPEIGVWQGPASPARFAAVWSALRASGYETLEGPSTVAPGAKLISIGVRHQNENVPQMRGGFWPTTPALAPVIAALETAIGELRAHPLRVLRGKATLSTPRIKKGNDLALRLKLTNAGTQPLTLGNPLATAPAAWSGIRLVLRDAGAKERQIDVTPADLRSSSTAAEALALLAPGASLDVDVKTKIDVPAGVHSVRVEVHGLVGDTPDPRFVGGTLWLDAGSVTIDRGAWWKLWQ